MTDWLDELVARSEDATVIGDTSATLHEPDRNPDRNPGEVVACGAAGERVLVSIIRTQGSCPRDAGTRMLVSTTECSGTIGGGHLEYRAIAVARERLAADEVEFRVERFVLGARLGQCCGGVVHVSFETIAANLPDWVTQLAAVRRSGEPAVIVTPLVEPSTAIVGTLNHHKLIVTSTAVKGHWQNTSLQRKAEVRARAMLCDVNEEPGRRSVEWQSSFLCERIDTESFRIAVFGAGHVGKALVETLAALPCRIDWIDSRTAMLPNSAPANVTRLHCDHPEDEVVDLPAGTCVVIMTHSHALDQRICEEVLKREDLTWCGLIGSLTKRKMFERRLRARGLGTRALARLNCPIGVAGIAGKHPAEIAIGVAAEILQRRQTWQSERSPHRQAVCS